MNKELFDTLSDKEKDNYYRKQFTKNGIFKKLFPGKNCLDVELGSRGKEIEQGIRRLLVQKNIVPEGRVSNLEDLHNFLPSDLKNYDFDSGVNGITQEFYETDERFEEDYLSLIKYLYNNHFKFPFYFQKTPTIRIHCPGGKNANHYPRYHTDIGYCHPPEEINLWLPLTKPIGKQAHGFRLMDLKNTLKILESYDYSFSKFIKSAINNKKFNEDCNIHSSQVKTPFGKALIFDARCLHTGEPMLNHTRISIDIRIIPEQDYNKSPYLFRGMGKRKILFQPGESYNTTKSSEL